MSLEAEVKALVTAISKQQTSIDKLVSNLNTDPTKPAVITPPASSGGSQADTSKTPAKIKAAATEATAAATTADEATSKFGKSVALLGASVDKFMKAGGAGFDAIQQFGQLGADKYDALAEQLGGLSDVSKGATESARKGVKDIDAIYTTYLGNQGASRELMIKRNGQDLNALDAFYSNVAQVQNNYLAVRDELAQRQTIKFNQMSKADVQKISIMEKGFQISNQKVGEILERQISKTGEASTQIFDEMSAYADAVSKKTGVSYQEIAGQIGDIITDVERFGNVQVDEAARIAGALNQLGLSYQGFGGMVDKFMNFDGAAESLGNLTTVFGVHFDAMEMMQLANEDQEEFLHRMREAFLDSGKAVEDMTLAEKKLASQQMGMSIQDFENFMQEDRELDDLTGTTADVKDADIEKGFDTMTKQMVLIHKTAEQMKEQVALKALDPMSQMAHKTGKNFEAMKHNIALDPGKYLPGYTKLHAGIQQSIKATFTDGSDVYGEAYHGELALLKDKIAQGKVNTLADAGKFTKELEAVMADGKVGISEMTQLSASKYGSTEVTAMLATTIAKMGPKYGQAVADEWAKSEKGKKAIEKGVMPDHKKVTKDMTDFVRNIDSGIMIGLEEKDMIAKSPSKYGRGIGSGFLPDASSVLTSMALPMGKINEGIGGMVDVGAGFADSLSSMNSATNKEKTRTQLASFNSHLNSSMAELVSGKDSVVGNLMKGKTDVKIKSPQLIEKLQSLNEKAVLAAETGQKASQEKADATLKTIESFMSAVSKALSKESTVQNILEIDGKAIAAQLMKIKVNDVGFSLTNAGGDST